MTRSSCGTVVAFSNVKSVSKSREYDDYSKLSHSKIYLYGYWQYQGS